MAFDLMLIAPIVVIAIIGLFFLQNKGWIMFFYRMRNNKGKGYQVFQYLMPDGSMSLYFKNPKGDKLTLGGDLIKLGSAADPFKELEKKSVDISKIYHRDNETGIPWHIVDTQDTINRNLSDRAPTIIPSHIWNQILLGVAGFFYNKGKREQMKRQEDWIIWIVVIASIVTCWQVLQLNDYVTTKLSTSISTAVVDALRAAGVIP